MLYRAKKGAQAQLFLKLKPQLRLYAHTDEWVSVRVALTDAHDQLKTG